MSLFFPIVQLVVLGYAFGGIVKHLRVAVVDQDHGISAVKVRELCNAVANGARTFETIGYSDQGHALDDLRNGTVNGVLIILFELMITAWTQRHPPQRMISLGYFLSGIGVARKHRGW